MVQVTTARTAESLTMARIRIDMFASKACLRAVGCWNFNKLPSTPQELVAEHLCEFAPASPSNVASEVRVLNHATDIEPLNHDSSVALGIVMRELMQQMFTLPSHLAMDTSNASICFLPVLGSFLSSGSNTLCPGESSESLFEMLWIRNEFAIRISKQIRDPAIKSNDWLGTFLRLNYVDLAHETCKPLVSIASNGTGLWFTFQRAMIDTPSASNLRKTQISSVESPGLWVWLAKTKNISVFALPVGRLSESFETSLPRLIEFDEKLSANIARDICQPRNFSSELSQFLDLIESCRIATLQLWPGVSHSPLFVSEIPEPTQSMLPRRQSLDLSWRWIDAKAKALVYQHVLQYTLACDTRKRFSYWQARCLQTTRPLGLRSKVPTKDHLTAGFRCTSRSLGERMHGFRGRACGVRIRARSCPSSRVIPSKSVNISSRQLTERSFLTTTSSCSIARRRTETLGRSFLESKLLCSVMWRCSTRHCQALRGKTTRRGFLPVLKGEVSAPEIR
jgi:hypothetical protein